MTHVHEKELCKLIEVLPTSRFRLCQAVELSAGSDKIHAKSKYLSTWWSTDFSKNYTVGRLMGLLFSPNLFLLKSFALLRKSGLYFGTVSGSGTGPLDYGATGPVPDP